MLLSFFLLIATFSASKRSTTPRSNMSSETFAQLTISFDIKNKSLEKVHPRKQRIISTYAKCFGWSLTKLSVFVWFQILFTHCVSSKSENFTAAFLSDSMWQTVVAPKHQSTSINISQNLEIVISYTILGSENVSAASSRSWIFKHVLFNQPESSGDQPRSKGVCCLWPLKTWHLSIT